MLILKKILCLSPHIDDVEYGMTGTILRYPNTIFDILEMIPANEARYGEAQRFWDSTPNCNLMFSELNFEYGVQEREWIKYLGGFLDLDSYGAVFIPPMEDSHFEHRLSNQIGVALMRNSTARIIEYRTPSTLNTWSPNLFVDVLATYEEKARRLAIFKSQRHVTYFSASCIESFHCNYQCVRRGLPLVESFRIVSMYV